MQKTTPQITSTSNYKVHAYGDNQASYFFTKATPITTKLCWQAYGCNFELDPQYNLTITKIDKGITPDFSLHGLNKITIKGGLFKRLHANDVSYVLMEDDCTIALLDVNTSIFHNCKTLEAANAKIISNNSVNKGNINASCTIDMQCAHGFENRSGSVKAGQELKLGVADLYNENGVIAGEESTNVTYKKGWHVDATSKIGHVNGNTQIKHNGTSSSDFGVIIGRNVDIEFAPSLPTSNPPNQMGKGIIAARETVTLSLSDRCMMLPNVEVQAPKLIIRAKDFRLADQTKCAVTTVKTHAQRPLALTHEYRTSGVVEIVEVDRSATEREVATMQTAPGIICQTY